MRRLLERRPDLTLSVSATTRPRRPSEQNGVHYSFLSEQGFDQLVGGDALLEWAEVFGNRYGTPAVPVERALAEGGDVILEIDVQGAGLVKERVPEAVLIFLVPPSMEELERRLRARGTEDEERLAARLATAGWEMGQRPWFDHVVVNDDVDEATAQVEAIIEVSRPPPAPKEGRAHP